MEITEKICNEKFFFYYIVSLMLLMPIGELITELMGVRFISQPIILGAYGIVGFIFGLINIKKKIKDKTLYPTDIFYILLIFFAFVSLIFSKNIIESCIGLYYDELPMHFLAYFALMFSGTMICDNGLKKKILYVFLIVAAIQGIVAFFQTFGLRIMESFYDPEWHTMYDLAFGLIQHNNWFAGLSTMFAAAAGGMFIFGDKKKKRTYFFLVLAILSIYVSLCTGARIAWVGNAAVIVFYGISFLVMRKNKYDGQKLQSYEISFLVLTAIYAVVIVILLLFTDYLKGGIDDFSREVGLGFEEFGTRRGYIWRFGLESIPHNWLTGVGLDNYAYAFFSNPKWSDGMWYQDKGHNEYLHTIVTEGVFAGINYIAMLVYGAVVAVRTVISTKDEEQRQLLWIYLGMFCGYAAQAFFNSSVINTAMYFWIVLGMTMPISIQKPLHKLHRNKN